MKIVSKDGRTWVEKKNDGKMAVGFTRALIEELGECWSILPAASARVEVKEGHPLCSIETNDGVFCVKSPVKGLIAFFAPEAINFPDRLSEDTTIATLKEKAEGDEFVEVPEEPQGALGWGADLRRAELNRQLGDLARFAPAEPQPDRRPNINPEVGRVRLPDLEEMVRRGNMTLENARNIWARAQELGMGIR